MKQFFALPAFAPIPQKNAQRKIQKPKTLYKSGRKQEEKKEDSRPFHKSAPMRIMTNDKMTKNY